MHLAFVLGTRPEIIKLSSLISACVTRGISYTLIHTNQHYAQCMDRLFFDELELPLAHFNLGVGSGTPGAQLGQMVARLEPILHTARPDYVVVQGDTNSALAGGLAGSKAGIPVAHVEAGLRSFDRSMPEETNRVLLDHLSSFWFCPSALQVELLAKEGIGGGQVYLTGNTGNDATLRYARQAAERSSIFARLKVQPGDYLLLTCHRPANTEDLAHFEALVDGVDQLAEQQGRQVVFPVHPRLRQQHWQVLRERSRILTIDPVGYLEMLALIQGAVLILTDSGGLQEEACVLQRRCLILRANTERPETLKSGGARLLASTKAADLIEAAQALSDAAITWSNPFGNGDAHRLILEALITVNLERLK